MNDIRRTILWVIFGFSLIMLWDNWQVHNGKKATFFPQPTQTATDASTAAQNNASATGAETLPQSRIQPHAQGTEQPQTNALPQARVSEILPQAADAQTITVQTNDLILEFSNMGGSLKKATLLHQAEFGHKENKEKGEEAPRLTLLDESDKRVYRADSGLVGTQGADLPSHLSKTPMSFDKSKDSDGNTVLRFTGSNADGVTLLKTYTIPENGYTLGVSHELQGDAPNAQLYMQLVRDGNDPPGDSFFYQTFTGPAIYSPEEHYEKVDFDDIADKSASFQRSTKAGFIAMVQHYFASAWLLPDGVQRENYTEQVGNNLYSVGTLTAIQPNQPIQARLFVGPQEEKRLEAIYPGFSSVKDYGIFTIIAKPMFWLVDQIHSMIGNWGWTIIALVILLKAAFFWLNAKAYSSMAKMKKLSPRITAMRERLKDDPRQMQMEMMKIYKEEKVNPMGGCFPILIQIPVFISLYWVILSTVEFRNAPWIGWIQDLSSPDPYYILPLLMAATSILQVWLNPKPPDEMQARLMWMMPIAFSIMFFFFPSGLVLYWLTNNILSIAQQWVINKRLGVLNND